MLSHIGEIYLSDSSRLVEAIERALHAGEASSHARAGDLTAAAGTFAQIQVLHGRVRDQLQSEMRQSA